LGGLRGEEEEVGVGGRFLEGFEEGVGGLRGEAFGVVKHGDFAASGEGAHLDALFQFADLIDEEAAGFGLGCDGMEVGVGGDAFRGALEEVRGELLDQGAFPSAFGTGDEVGMGEALLLAGLEEKTEGLGGGEGHALLFKRGRRGGKPRVEGGEGLGRTGG
jgi:hypothetical protein